MKEKRFILFIYLEVRVQSWVASLHSNESKRWSHSGHVLGADGHTSKVESNRDGTGDGKLERHGRAP